MNRNLLILSLCLTVLGSPGEARAQDIDVVPTSPAYMRGDVDINGEHNLADVIAYLIATFGNRGRLACQDAADVNDDGRLSLGDAVHNLFALFARGLPPEMPYPDCGYDPTEDNLGCESYNSCPSEEVEIFHLRNSGLLCITQPCFSWTARAADSARGARPMFVWTMTPLALTTLCRDGESRLRRLE